MMTNYFLKLLCGSSSCRTEQQNLQQYNFNKLTQQKTCVSPKHKSHWNKNRKCSYCPSFLVFFFSVFVSFSDHIFLFFFLFFFFLIFSTVTSSACIFFSLWFVLLSILFFFFKSLVNCSFCILPFFFTSVLIIADFIYPSLVISDIN